MATTANFDTMLNEYLSNELLKEEYAKRDWLYSNTDKDESWAGGSIIVPFKASGASSVAFGALTASNDVSTDRYTRGSVSTQPEVWGTLAFEQKDLWRHGKLSEQNFLKMLPDQVEEFMDYFKVVISHGMLNGTAICKLSGDGASDGTFTVDRPERFVLKQKVYFVDDNTTISAAGYVQTINMSTGVISVDTTRAGGADLDISAFTVAQNAKVYFDGSYTAGFSSLRMSLLSAANGGDTNLYGVAKTTSPYTQAIQVDGSSVTSSNILQKIFDGYVTVRQRGKGNPNTLVMSFRNFGWILTQLEVAKGAYHQDQTSRKVSVYGWDEVMVTGVKGSLKIVAIHECDDDVIMYLDMRPNVMKIYSNGGIRKRVAPDGKEYFESRATTGYTYLVDVAFMGDFVLLKPSFNGIMYGIV